jgi:hypothetical protein
MESIIEVSRRASPASKPQSLAFDGSDFWMGSRETRHLYAIDPRTWTSRDLGEAPGTPWGIAVTGRELRVCTGEAPNDNRFIRRYVMGSGFDPDFRLACPEDTGSQLSYDGHRVYVSQWYKKRILALSDLGDIERTIEVPHGICGHVFAKGDFYCVTTDDEESGPYYLTRVGRMGGGTDLAAIPFPARALTLDGAQFWTNHREADQIVSFQLPDGL